MVKRPVTNNKISPTIEQETLDSIADIVSHYLNLKEFLVQQDLHMATKEGHHVLQLIKYLTPLLSKHRTILHSMKIETEKIIVSNNITELRKNFKSLSLDVEQLIDYYRPIENTIYVQQCPMVNKGEGAIWLSKEKTIANPYFGNSMYNCGTVKDSILR